MPGECLQWTFVYMWSADDQPIEIGYESSFLRTSKKKMTFLQVDVPARVRVMSWTPKVCHSLLYHHCCLAIVLMNGQYGDQLTVTENGQYGDQRTETDCADDRLKKGGLFCSL